MAVKPDPRRSPSAPSVDEVQRIVAIESPVVRNLEITYCYRGSRRPRERIGKGANWCTYATWASRQAGGRSAARTCSRTWSGGSGKAAGSCIRRDALAQAPRRGLFHRNAARAPDRELHTPFDAFERASDCGRPRQPQGVRRDRARVRAVPRDRRPPTQARHSPEGQRLLSQAFAHYERRRLEKQPPGTPSSPCSRTSRSASTSRRACSRRSSRRSMRRRPHRRIWAAGPRRALAVRVELVGMSRLGRRRARHPSAGDSASLEQARARGDHRHADGAGPARDGC